MFAVVEYDASAGQSYRREHAINERPSRKRDASWEAGYVAGHSAEHRVSHALDHVPVSSVRRGVCVIYAAVLTALLNC